MSGKLALATISASCALCFALAGCGGESASSSAASTTANSATSDSSVAETSSATEAATDNHNSYLVGKWELYATADTP